MAADTPFWHDDHLTLYGGDCRAVMAGMPAESVHCVVTSPPYWGLRDYGNDGQLGLEATPEAYVANMVDVFREVRRVLRDDGTLWLNLGDSYASHDPGERRDGEFLNPNGVQYDKGRKSGPSPRNRAGNYRPGGLIPKQLVGIPWRVAFALQADGWYLRSDIIWSKPNPMPESVTDRPTKAHEYLFLLAKSPRYYFDAEAVREPAESGPSDLRKMAEGRERIGGLVKDATDPLMAASGLTNIGQKRSVGGRPLERERNVGGRHDGFTRMPGGEAEWAENGRPGRNLRTVWTIATEPYPGAHFATFPRKLVEPCVKAGTSERGVCPECGAPWLREIERARGPAVASSDLDRYGTGEAGVHRKVGGQYQKYLDANPPQTPGWRPSCAHDAGFLPATVLDPFAGSGTTLLVAQSLGRRGVGIDLNPEYLEQVIERNAQTPLGLVG